jgi:hypothetical protein
MATSRASSQISAARSSSLARTCARSNGVIGLILEA